MVSWMVSWMVDLREDLNSDTISRTVGFVVQATEGEGVLADTGFPSGVKKWQYYSILAIVS